MPPDPDITSPVPEEARLPPELLGAPSRGPRAAAAAPLEERLSIRFLCLLHTPLLRGLFRLSWAGVENVPAVGPAILCPNHASFLDPPSVTYPIYHGAGRRLPRWMAVDIYFREWVGWYMRAYEAFPVRLDRRDPAAYREALRTLADGRLLGIFAEGERTPDGRLLSFRDGAALLAARSGAPIIPVTINGSFAAWPIGRKHPRWFSRLEVVYHPPFTVPASARHDRAAIQAATRRIEEAVRSRYVPPAAAKGTPR